MKLYDISQEVFSCVVFPGDPAPQREILNTMESGGLYNLTAFSMCAHNGTHVDAPAHFLPDSPTIEKIPVEKFVGESLLVHHDGDVTAEAAKAMVGRLGDIPRLLIAGKATVTREAAHVFADAKLFLVGNESQSVGPEDSPVPVHKILLGKGIALLEGVVLKDVPQGRYFLSAAPLNLGGAEGAPCRAYLIDWEG